MFKLTLACVFLFIASLEARKGNSTSSFLFHTVHDHSNHPGLGSSSRLTFKSVDEIRRCDHSFESYRNVIPCMVVR